MRLRPFVPYLLAPLTALAAWFIFETLMPVPTPPRPAPFEGRQPQLVQNATSSSESALVPAFQPPEAATTAEPARPRPSAAGTLPVEAVADIGAIGTIAWHPGVKSLFMAVYEPDGLRSVWKLLPDGRPLRVISANRNAGEMTVEVDKSGAVYAEWNNPAMVMRSDDEGDNWTSALEGQGIFWQIATGYGDVRYGALHEDNLALLYRSVDAGVSWSPWMDFQKILPRDATLYDPFDYHYRLRHLHGVILQNDTILVGTGDVARYTLASVDGGDHWKQVWDEGFTASVATSEGDSVLLAPDQLHSHGIAKLDMNTWTTKEVWNPIPYGWAGFCYSMLDIGGFYYAGLHTETNSVEGLNPKYGIIVSPDTERWYPLLTLGPVTKDAYSTLWLAKGDGVVYVSLSGTLYTLPQIDVTWFKGKTPFAKP